MNHNQLGLIQQKNLNYNNNNNEDNLLQDSSLIDFESILYQALVNEGKHIKVLKSKRQSFTYNEKQLRDAAAAEVALQCQYPGEENDKGTRKRKQMSNEEKSQQNRDRNREHAKNTRLRKKAYVTKLKELVDQLSLQKTMEVKDRVSLGKRIYDTQITRKNIVRTFLYYRATNVQDLVKWSSILDEKIVLIMPITPYMSFNKSEVVNGQRIITGINSIIAETAALSLMVESIGFATTLWTDSIIHNAQGCRITYEIGGKREIISAGDLVTCRYFMKSEGHENVGSPIQLIQQGMLQCKFNKSNKIISAEMIFDVMSFMQQFQRASLLSPGSSIIPNSLDMAMQSSNSARLIVSLETNYPVTFVNSAWWKLVGYSESLIPSEDEYKTIPLQQILNMHNFTHRENQGKFIDYLLSLLPRVSRGIPVRLSQITYSKDNKKVLNYLRIVPLVNENMKISYALISMYETYPSPHNEGTIRDDNILLSTPTVINQFTPTITTSRSDSDWSIFRQQQQQQQQQQFHLPQNFHQSIQNSQIQNSFQNSLSFQTTTTIHPPIIDPVWGTHLSISRTIEPISTIPPLTDSFSQNRSTLLYNNQSNITVDQNRLNSLNIMPTQIIPIINSTNIHESSISSLIPPMKISTNTITKNDTTNNFNNNNNNNNNNINPTISNTIS